MHLLLLLTHRQLLVHKEKKEKLNNKVGEIYNDVVSPTRELMEFDFTSDVFRAWAGAWLDTEGYICIVAKLTGATRLKNRNYGLKIGICQYDKRPLETLKSVYGGHIGRKQKFLPSWEWRASSKIAKRFLIEILPFLVVKKEQAIYAIEFQSLVEKRINNGQSVPKDQQKRRLELRSKINKIKKLPLSVSP